MEIIILGILLILGIVLILIEILFIPGTTIFGIFGVISIVSSDYLAFQYYGYNFGVIYSILSSFLILIIIIYSLKSNTWNKLALKKIHVDSVDKNKYDNLKVGDLGITTSSLKPYGKGLFFNKSYEVKSKENFIEENKKIKIINILQDKILVKKIK